MVACTYSIASLTPPGDRPKRSGRFEPDRPGAVRDLSGVFFVPPSTNPCPSDPWRPRPGDGRAAARIGALIDPAPVRPQVSREDVDRSGGGPQSEYYSQNPGDFT